jgi:DNA-damage-inducible protein J
MRQFSAFYEVDWMPSCLCACRCFKRLLDGGGRDSVLTLFTQLRYNDPMTTLHVRLDGKRKKQAQKILAQLGLDLSQAVRLFIHQICITEGVPLQLLTENGFSVEEEEELLRDAQAARAGKGVKRYKNVEDLFHTAHAAIDDRHASQI